MTFSSSAKLGFLTSGLLLALSGCSSSSDSSGDDGNMVATAAGAAAPAGAGGAATPTAGGTGGKPVATSGAGGTTPVPGAGGAGGMPVAGSDAAGGAGAAATGGTGAANPKIDTTGFIANCMSGGANWGMPGQAGPCAAGTTIYGVDIPFGPYGASSEYNVGKGFENAISASDNASGCSNFINSFGADPKGSADLKDTHDLNLALYTIYYPGNMPEGEKFPLITWANGTCAMPEGYGTLLRYIASHGYIVVAANSRYTQSGTPLPQIKGIDFMLAANADATSKYYKRIDTDKIGAAGHSQGSAATVTAASDARIKAVILFNGGNNTSKPFLAISGQKDLFDLGSAQYKNAATASQQPAAYLYFHQIPASVDGSTTGALAPGHLTLMMEPERVTEVSVAWFDMMLKGDAAAKAMFVGDKCTLCDGTAYPSKWVMPATPPAIEYGHNAKVM